MNNFTKQELEGILEVADYYLERGIPLYSEKFIDKIQSKIDNYCEHDFHGDFHVCVDKCRKCGVIACDNQ